MKQKKQNKTRRPENEKKKKQKTKNKSKYRQKAKKKNKKKKTGRLKKGKATKLTIYNKLFRLLFGTQYCTLAMIVKN